MSWRPRTRGECPPQSERPCPYVGCRHHNYLEVNPETGTILFHFPDIEPEDMEHSCSLDSADEDGLTADEVGKRINASRQRVQQIESKAYRKLKRRLRGEE